MKLLLITTAILEGVAGLALLVIPTVAISMLLGMPLDTSAGLVGARIAGVALLSLTIACWRSRNGEQGNPATGVIEAILFYNFVTAMVLSYTGIRLGLGSAMLWLAIVLHLCLGLWCLVNLWFTRRKLITV